jgi:hypothetical protein
MENRNGFSVIAHFFQVFWLSAKTPAIVVECSEKQRLLNKPDRSEMPVFQSAEAGAGTNFNGTATLAFQKRKIFFPLSKTSNTINF